MKTRIAFFRGINVGGNNILPMKSLSVLLENNGYQNVKTYIQSGNVVFNANKSKASTISELINKEFGFTPKVLILDFEELKKAVSNSPFKLIDGQEPEGKTVHFYFCDSKPKMNPEIHNQLKKLSSNFEQFDLIGSVFYLYAPNGIGRSKLAAKIEAILGVDTTARNMNTVRKVIEME